jgi:hypothetical protein
MNKKFDETFQSCLDLIRGGQETIESVIARYPEYADELRVQLEGAIWLSTSSAALDPRPGFVSASRNRLVSRIKQEQQPELTTPITWSGRLQQFFSVQKVVPAAFVFVLMLALFVSGSVVSASQKALPGDDLYSVKRTLEQIALATSLDEKNDAELQIQFVEKRLTEVQALIVEERYEEVAETIKEYEEEVNKTLQILQTVYDEDRFLAIELAVELETLLAEQKNILAILIRNAPASVDFSVYRVWVTTEIVGLAAEEFTNFVPSPLSVPPVVEPTIPPTRTPRPTPTYAPTERPVRPSPIPTNTPKPPTPVPPTNTPLPTNTPVPTSTPVPTNTPVPTDTPTNTPLPTDTPTPTPTDNPTPTNTPLPTDTPTNTPTPIASPTEATPPDSTSVPPTQQQGNEATATPTP